MIIAREQINVGEHTAIWDLSADARHVVRRNGEQIYVVRGKRVWSAWYYRGAVFLEMQVADCRDEKVADALRRQYNADLHRKHYGGTI